MCPPTDGDQFPPFAESVASVDQAEMLQVVNRGQQRRNAVQLAKLTEVLATGRQFVMTWPELDPYQTVRRKTPVGPIEPLPENRGVASQLFPGSPLGSTELSFFAYLSADMPSVEMVMLALAKSGFRGRTYFRDATPQQLNMLREAGITVDCKPPDVPSMLGMAGLVVHHGGAGLSSQALAAGCPVIVKSHPLHAGTGEMVASAVIKAAEKTGMPNGVFSNLNSSGIEVGQVLVQHPKVKAVGFTGSIKGGRALYDLAAKRDEPIPVFAEMGSINPVVLLPKALNNRAEAIAKTYSGSITLGSGQFCTNPGLIIGIKSEGLTNFVNTLADEIVKVEPSCMLHPNIAGAYETNKTKALSQNGLKVLAGYENEVEPNFARQLVTTVEGKTFLNNPTLHHEVFGPFSLVVQCENEVQLEAVISNLEGQLTGTIISDDNEITEHTKIVNALENRVGRIIFNGVPTGVEVCPSMQHGGPYPASTDSRFTAVGVDSIKRFVRPFSFQDWPNNLLPNELKDENPLGISRLVNNVKITAKI